MPSRVRLSSWQRTSEPGTVHILYAFFANALYCVYYVFPVFRSDRAFPENCKARV
jgi:hypothetical protein